LNRLLGPRDHASRFLHLRDVARRVDYWPYASRLEASLLQYSLARRHFPETYSQLIKLRQPAYVRLLLSNAFPRMQVTTRWGAGKSLYYGPFPTRAAAEQYEEGVLDLFQIRRCQEDLTPAQNHPGCVYGEMNKCLRPCQLVVSAEEYGGETDRVRAFLESDGQSLLDSVRAARDRFSEEMEFEEAARTHKRWERVAAAAQARGDLATNAQQLCGVAVVPSAQPEHVGLWFFEDGCWRAGAQLSLAVEEGKPAPMDRRLKELAAALPPASRISLRDRQEHQALLTAWYFSNWREGEWVSVESIGHLPYRRLVNAVHRVATGTGSE
ncbi:MAG: hypothetical protein HYZ37_15620, partial [Candidatus Solibacter usitatus]|nr:hypothetical protein [Candidatus Solibacter usitatus]